LVACRLTYGFSQANVMLYQGYSLSDQANRRECFRIAI
jgi:hypothetical protein